MKKELGHEAIYDARQLGTPRMLVLGLQHMFAMFGATVLVPILVQGYGLPLSIQTTLLFAGLGTLLFHVCTKMKVPAFLGSSFAYLGGFETVAKLNAGKYAGMSGDEKLAYALGGIVIAGLLYLVLALLFKMLGAKKVMRYFPPIVTGPMIIMIGLNLSGSAINNAATCWWLALVAMAIIVVANIWGKGMVKIIPILLGVVGSYLVALIATACGAQLPDADGVMQPLVNFASVSKANLIGLQQFVIAKFDVSAILVMAPIAIAAMMEHIGDVSAISSTTGRNFIEDPGLHRTLVGDGLATALAGMFGGPANTTYGENTGVLALSKVYDPRVVRLAAVYAIILSFSPKFDALVRHRRRRQLHPLRHDLRGRCAQHRGESGRPHQVPQPHHRGGHVRQRPGLQSDRRRDLHRRRRGRHPLRSCHRGPVRRDPQRRSARQRLCLRRQRRGRQVRRPRQLLK